MADNAMPDPVAGEIVHRLFALVEQVRAHFELVAAEFGLTPTQGLALRYLGEPLQMGRLAELLHCERSNVTLVIDRLTKRGVVERQPDPADRRVRWLVLTEDGLQLREQLKDQVFEQIPAVAGLDQQERAAFLDLLRRLTPETSAEPDQDTGGEVSG